MIRDVYNDPNALYTYEDALMNFVIVCNEHMLIETCGGAKSSLLEGDATLTVWHTVCTAGSFPRLRCLVRTEGSSLEC